MARSVNYAAKIEKLEDFKLVQRQVVDWIGESINVSRDVTVRLPRTIILVGPTGVGKTTTLVKLAAQNVIAAKKNGKVIRISEKEKIKITEMCIPSNGEIVPAPSPWIDSSCSWHMDCLSCANLQQ